MTLWSERRALPKYFFSAAISVIANLLAQEATVQAAPGAPVMVSIVVGTLFGFFVKYLMDKTWTFRDSYTTHSAESRKIVLSGLFSVVTTIIFWTFELSFLAIWQTDLAKYTGATLGLTIGYFVKFLFDRTYVFKERRS